MRILVVQTAALGDLLLTLPLVAELRRVQPEARLALVTTPLGAELLAGLGTLDALHGHAKGWRVRSAAATVAWLRGERFEAAIAAQRSHRTGLLLALSRAPLRIGFAGAPGAWSYHAPVAPSAGRHAVQRYLELSRPLGGDPDSADPRPRLPLTDGARAASARWLAGERVARDEPLVGLAPGSQRRAKRWLPERFAALAAAVARRGFRPLLLGSAAEQELCGEVARASGVAAVVAAGRLGVLESAALLARARVLVANDCGAAHLAAAVGTPVLSIFGPTTPGLGYAPFGEHNRVVERLGLSCRPCHRHGPRRCPLGHFRCMRDIPAELVLEQLEPLLEPRPASGVQTRPGKASSPAARMRIARDSARSSST
jgi:heptosyltransferase-2